MTKGITSVPVAFVCFSCFVHRRPHQRIATRKSFQFFPQCFPQVDNLLVINFERRVWQVFMGWWEISNIIHLVYSLSVYKSNLWSFAIRNIEHILSLKPWSGMRNMEPAQTALFSRPSFGRQKSFFPSVFTCHWMQFLLNFVNPNLLFVDKFEIEKQTQQIQISYRDFRGKVWEELSKNVSCIGYTHTCNTCFY